MKVVILYIFIYVLGAFGTIYKAKHIQKYNLFAVKIEKLKKVVINY